MSNATVVKFRTRPDRKRSPQSRERTLYLKTQRAIKYEAPRFDAPLILTRFQGGE